MIEGEQFIYTPREWQQEGFDACHSANTTRGHQFVNVIAGVGSGKTDVAAYALYDWIRLNPNATTVSMFIAPTINLCNQQEESIGSYIKWMLRHNTRINPSSVKFIPINSRAPERQDIVDLMELPEGYHYIITVCKPSYFGEKKYYPFWGRIFRAWYQRGFAMGVRAYDEAHNYKSKADLIVGGAAFFHADVLMSGTPAEYQTQMDTEHKALCSVQNSMAHGWTVCPKLYFVKAIWNDSKVAIIRDMIMIEAKLSKDEGIAPRMMVCCKNIAEVWEIANLPLFSQGLGEYINVITIHSETKGMTPLVNGQQVTPEEAMRVVKQLDSGAGNSILREYGVNTDVITVVFQVDMVSEGINVKSFNSVIVTTSNSRRAMQQFGRVFRNFDVDGYSKRKNGHASVYVVQPSAKEFVSFFRGLRDKYGVNFDCFDLSGQKLN